MKRLAVTILLLSFEVEAIVPHAAILHQAGALLSGPAVIDAMAASVFRAKCLDCHGGLNGPDPRHMFGANGVPRPGRESVTVHTINAPAHDRIHMPPNGAAPLNDAEKGIIARWAQLHSRENKPPTLTAAVQRGLFRRANLYSPALLANQLRGPAANRPRLWNIGPQEDILGAVPIGDLNLDESINRLDAAEARLPNKNVPIIIYCGCCELEHCPNVLRAIQILHDRGYTQVKVLNLPSSLADDYHGPMAPPR